MICQQSGTEFHFPDLDKQLCLIQQMFEKRDRSKSNASEHQQLPSADAALRPLTLNTGLSFSYPVQFQSHVENIRIFIYIYLIYWQTRYNGIRKKLNPFNPKSDENLISPCSHTAESFIKIMRIKEMIINLRGFDCVTNSPS